MGVATAPAPATVPARLPPPTAASAAFHTTRPRRLPGCSPLPPLTASATTSTVPWLADWCSAVPGRSSCDRSGKRRVGPCPPPPHGPGPEGSCGGRWSHRTCGPGGDVLRSSPPWVTALYRSPKYGNGRQIIEVTVQCFQTTALHGYPRRFPVQSHLHSVLCCNVVMVCGL